VAMKKESRRDHNPVKAESEEASNLAARLAPPEEREQSGAQPSGNNRGGIVVDTGALKLPRDFVEERDDRSRPFRPDPVVVLIFILSLAFIAVVAYLISIEPPK
jgi:hypothetical protein